MLHFHHHLQRPVRHFVCGRDAKQNPLQIQESNLPAGLLPAISKLWDRAIDCTEVAVSNTENLDTQSHLCSHDKGCTTLKALIGVAPIGVITFTSDLYGGMVSDKARAADCGVLQQLEAGDMDGDG